MAVTAREAVVKGVPMRWEESGSGRPVILVHGIPTSPRLWRHVLPRVVGARCLAWEMVGYGGSIAAGRGRDISVRRQAGYLVDWMGELEIDEAIIVGHALGGGVVQIAAVNHKERCSGLVLANSIGYDSWPIPSVKAMNAARGLLASLPLAVFRALFISFIRRGHDDPIAAREAVDTHWPHYAGADGAAAFARQVGSLRVQDTLEIAPRLPRLRVPTALVWGAADQFQKLRYGVRFAADLGVTLSGIEGGRHFVPEDHPDEVAAAIARVLARRGAV